MSKKYCYKCLNVLSIDSYPICYECEDIFEICVKCSDMNHHTIDNDKLLYNDQKHKNIILCIYCMRKYKSDVPNTHKCAVKSCKKMDNGIMIFQDILCHEHYNLLSEYMDKMIIE